MKPYYDNSLCRLFQADARDMSFLPDKSVDCIVTSPPYWSARKYPEGADMVWDGEDECEHVWGPVIPNPMHKSGKHGPASILSVRTKTAEHEVRINSNQGQFCRLCGGWRGQLGLEPTIELYLDHLLQILDTECKRVLKPVGVMWINIGSCYDDLDREDIPWEFVRRMKSRGWTLRREIVWWKPNPMPESPNGWRWERHKVKVGRDYSKPKMQISNPGDHFMLADNYPMTSSPIYEDCPGCPKCLPNDGLVLLKWNWRPTTTHEWIFMFTRSNSYYCDAEAVREVAHDWGSRDRSNFRGGTDDPLLKHHGLTDGDFAKRGRNLRSVWRFNSDDTQDDRLYKVSPNCPIHSPLLDPEIRQKVECGEPQYALWSHTFDMYNRLVLVPSLSLLSNLLHNSEDDHLSNWGYHHHESEYGRIPENIHGNKRLTSCCYGAGQECGHQTLSRTNHNETEHVPEADNCDLPRLGYGLIATSHNREIHRIVSVIALHDTVFLRIPSRIVHILLERGCICPYTHYTPSHFPMSTIWKFPTQSYPESHFATFPMELPLRCIKAGTSEKGNCPKCGMPWARVVERGNIKPLRGDSTLGRKREGDDSEAYHWKDTEYTPGIRQSSTLGWRPSCEHKDLKPIPAVVLDPFVGSGTSCAAATQLGRASIGVDIVPEYLKLAVKRLGGRFEVVTKQGIRVVQEGLFQ